MFVLVSVGHWSDKICWPAGVEKNTEEGLKKIGILSVKFVLKASTEK